MSNFFSKTNCFSSSPFKILFNLTECSLQTSFGRQIGGTFVPERTSLNEREKDQDIKKLKLKPEVLAEAIFEDTLIESDRKYKIQEHFGVLDN